MSSSAHETQVLDSEGIECVYLNEVLPRVIPTDHCCSLVNHPHHYWRAGYLKHNMPQLHRDHLFGGLEGSWFLHHWASTWEPLVWPSPSLYTRCGLWDADWLKGLPCTSTVSLLVKLSPDYSSGLLLLFSTTFMHSLITWNQTILSWGIFKSAF